MKPLLETARLFDIATNTAAAALFDAGSGGFSIWCTPEDHPGDAWKKLAGREKAFLQGAFSKPCEYVASVTWIWGAKGVLKGIGLKTTATALVEHGLIDRDKAVNRPEDLTWARSQIQWLWQASTAPGPMPPIIIKEN